MLINIAVPTLFTVLVALIGFLLVRKTFAPSVSSDRMNATVAYNRAILGRGCDPVRAGEHRFMFPFSSEGFLLRSATCFHAQHLQLSNGAPSSELR